MRRLDAAVLTVCTVSGALCCTWTRFDDITSNTPVERLEAPSNVSGLGLSMATFATSSGAMLATTSRDQLVLYDLGDGVQPSHNASAVQACAGDKSCVLGAQMAGIGPQDSTNQLGCVAYGVGTSTDAQGTTSGQVWLLCEDLQQHSLPAPDSVTSFITGPAANNETTLALSTTRRSTIQPLVVAMPDVPAIWFYDGIEPTPIDLPELPDGQVAGRALGVIAESASYLVVASSTAPDNNVWLYRVSSDRTSALVGCVQGQAQFGRLLTTGNFDDDTIDDLAIADGMSVTLVKGSSLSALADIGSPTCVTVESLQPIGQALCPQLSELDGCAAQPFATSLATGNLDGVGRDELIIGAANTSVRGERAAGALFIHTVAENAVRPVQGLYISTASSGDTLGSSTAVAHVASIDAVFAGAPGSSSVLAFYCNSLIPAPSKSARCP